MIAQLIQLAMPRTIPAVTVLMPHFGCERFVAAATASILGQSFGDLELWILDDASPSTCWLAALEPFRADPRLRLFASDVNVGTYRLKTLAIGAVGSAMIAFQDSDDVSEPERLALQLQALARRRLDIVGCAYRIIDSDDRVVGQRRMPRWCNWVERLGKTHFIHHPTSLVRSSVFDKVGAFDGTTRIGADTDFILRAAQRVRIGNIAQPLYRYRQHPDSLTAAAETGYGSPSREHYVALTRSRWREARRAGSEVVLAPTPIDVAFTLNEIAP